MIENHGTPSLFFQKSKYWLLYRVDSCPPSTQLCYKCYSFLWFDYSVGNEAGEPIATKGWRVRNHKGCPFTVNPVLRHEIVQIVFSTVRPRGLVGKASTF